MSHHQPALSLDHVAYIGRDLAKDSTLWEKLGFTLSPHSRQQGNLPGRRNSGPWATANRCAVFKEGYLELIGTVDSEMYNPWQRFVERFEGLHILALRCSSADETWLECKAFAHTLHPPVSRERRLEVSGQQKVMRFRNIFGKDEYYPEGKLILIEHQTPQYLWQPHLLQHSNGALGLKEVMLVTNDLTETIDRMLPLTGNADMESEGICRMTLDGGGSLVVFESPLFAKRFGSMPSSVPSLSGITVTFRDRLLAARLIESHGVRVDRGDQDWFVPAEECGFVLKLVSA